MTLHELFYTLFRIAPRSLFQLAGVDIEGRYVFEPLPGPIRPYSCNRFWKSLDGIGPNIFFEIQTENDPHLYWRVFENICAYYNQHTPLTPFIAVILFFDVADDPENCPFACELPHHLLRVFLPERLKALDGMPGIFTILKPFALEKPEALHDAVRYWKAELYSLEFPEETTLELLSLLEYAIIRRFPDMRRKELETMLQLPPLEETAIGQELFESGKSVGQELGFEEGRTTGFEEGLKKGQKIGERKGVRKGEVIGQILMAQRVLKRPVSSERDLSKKHVSDLREVLARLEAEL